MCFIHIPDGVFLLQLGVLEGSDELVLGLIHLTQCFNLIALLFEGRLIGIKACEEIGDGSVGIGV